MNLLITIFCQSRPQVGALFVPCTKAGNSINLKGFQDKNMINVLSGLKILLPNYILVIITSIFKHCFNSLINNFLA